MTKYGFVIDQRRCIGCHACTVACKSENQVPLGVFRTWVKYIEKGQFPNTRRYFTVERCQHCEKPPCVEICPTSSLFKRPDGIVDFDPERCIGCKSCMQACPYDALYIDPESHTAAKCNYCAHRTDRGLLPACVIVCPTKAIIAGDLEDPQSEIAETLARQPVQVRRADQGTRPQVFYVGADEMAITPGLAAQPGTYMSAQVGPAGADLEPKGSVWSLAGMDLPGSATEVGATGGAAQAVTVYDVPHPKPWGWKVATYLWTKSIAAGALLVGGPLAALGLATPSLNLAAGLVAVLFTLLTAILLVWDLKRPERFWRVMLTPNPRSWLVRGAYILAAYGTVTALLTLAALLGWGNALRVLAWPAALLAAATAGYSAFLFGQAEGRDFWQSPMLLWHLLAGAVQGGAAALLLATAATTREEGLLTNLGAALLAAVLATAALALAELYAPHANKDLAAAAALLKRGPLARRFWTGFLLVGVVLPALLLAVNLPLGLSAGMAFSAALLALAGLWTYEDLWIRAGQSVPMS